MDVLNERPFAWLHMPYLSTLSANGQLPSRYNKLVKVDDSGQAQTAIDKSQLPIAAFWLD